MTVDIASLVSDNLDIWTTAVERKSGAGRGGGKRVSLYGIAALRALIFELAVRGKLAPQDARDEPTSELLAKIYAERTTLLQAGKISKPKKLPAVDPNDGLAPPSWGRVRFGDLFSLEYGDNLPEPKRSGTGEYNVFGSNGVVGTHNTCRVEKPCLVVGRKGSAGAINRSYQPCWVTDVAYYCVPPTGIDLDYQYILFKTLSLDELGKGIKPGLNRNEVNILAVAVPPTAEQRRIVAKVDELMALCDALEAESVAAMYAHQALVEALLANLTASTDAADLATSWARLEAHFGTLFTTEASLDALKRTILELAVLGKLVAQNPQDEPASELIKMIADAESAGNYKKRNISEHEKGSRSFSIPPGWEQVQVGDVFSIRTGFAFKSSTYSPEGTLVFRVTNFDRQGLFDLSDAVYFPTNEIDDKMSGFLLEEDDIVMVMVGGTIGKTTIIDRSILPALLNQNMWRIRSFGKKMVSGFELLLVKFLNSKIEGLTQSTHGHFAMGDFTKRRVLIPPFAEQRRIVAKAGELMTLCETLKSRLIDAAGTQQCLADVVIEKVAT